MFSKSQKLILKKTVVVMQTVGQMNVEPFMNKCKSNSFGPATMDKRKGTALGKLLTGQINPSGRLSSTWYKNADISKMELANSSKRLLTALKDTIQTTISKVTEKIRAIHINIIPASQFIHSVMVSAIQILNIQI